jgi:hypothetical protein
MVTTTSAMADRIPLWLDVDTGEKKLCKDEEGKDDGD